MKSDFVYPIQPPIRSRWRGACARLCGVSLISLWTVACPPEDEHCGDQVVDLGEECDDGNAFDGDGCSASCQVEPGFVCSAEGPCSVLPDFCDGAEASSGCAPSSYCGDGIVDEGETCDDGPANGAGYAWCAADCSFGPYCGDGIVDEIEECDDGNGTAGDGCGPGCQLEFLGD